MIESIESGLSTYILIISPNDDITTFAGLSYCCATYWPTIAGFCSLIYGTIFLSILF